MDTEKELLEYLKTPERGGIKKLKTIVYKAGPSQEITIIASHPEYSSSVIFLNKENTLLLLQREYGRENSRKQIEKPILTCRILDPSYALFIYDPTTKQVGIMHLTHSIDIDKELSLSNDLFQTMFPISLTPADMQATIIGDQLVIIKVWKKLLQQGFKKTNLYIDFSNSLTCYEKSKFVAYDTVTEKFFISEQKIEEFCPTFAQRLQQVRDREFSSERKAMCGIVSRDYTEQSQRKRIVQNLVRTKLTDILQKNEELRSFPHSSTNSNQSRKLDASVCSEWTRKITHLEQGLLSSFLKNHTTQTLEEVSVEILPSFYAEDNSRYNIRRVISNNIAILLRDNKNLNNFP